MNKILEDCDEIELGKILNFQKKSKHKAADGKEEGKFIFFTSSNIQAKFIDEFDFDGECLIFGTGGNASLHYCNEKMSTTADCLVAKISDPSINTKFVYNYLIGNVHLLEAGFRGAGLKHISKAYIQKIKIKIPKDKEIQDKIVEILDKANYLRELRYESDKLTCDYLTSTYLNIFGDPIINPNSWPVSKIRSISIRISDGPFGSNLKTEHYVSKGIRVIRLQNIGVGEFIDNDKAYISESHYKKLKKHTCYPGDVIIGTMGDPNLRACILPDHISMAINKADCVQLRPNKSLVTPEYLCYLINSAPFVSKASSLMHGQTRTRISMSQVASLEIPVPPIVLQSNFSKIVRKVEEVRSDQKNSKDEINILYSSLMQNAFKGELLC